MGLLTTFAVGGILDDTDLEIVDAGWVTGEYKANDGRTYDPFPAMKLVYRDLSGVLEDPVDTLYKCGKVEDWKPSTDGKSIKGIGKPTHFHGNSKVAIWAGAAMEVGIPEELLEQASEDITKLVGLKFHANEKVIKGGKNIKDYSVLVPTRLIALPGEAEAADMAEIDKKLVKTIKAALKKAKNGKLNKGRLGNVVSKAMKDEDATTRSVAVARAFDDGFLAENFAFEGGFVAAGGFVAEA